MLAALRRQGLDKSKIARAPGRHRSPVRREVRRNSARADGRHRASTAQERTNGRRSRSRRDLRFTARDFALVDGLLCRQWSPEQVAGHLARSGQLSISHETIYRHVWRDKKEGGLLLDLPPSLMAAQRPAVLRRRGSPEGRPHRPPPPPGGRPTPSKILSFRSIYLIYCRAGQQRFR